MNEFSENVKIRSIRSVMIIGAGVMGWQIGLMIAQKRKRVTIVDIDNNRLSEVKKQIENNLQRRIDKNKISQEKKSEILKNLTFNNDMFENLGEIDLVLECIPEKIEMKRKIFLFLQENKSKHTICCSNSSSFEISYILETQDFTAAFKDMCANLHFFNPVFTLPLVEIYSESEIVAKFLRSFIRKIGYHPVVLLKPSPGFIANRILAGVFREMFELLESGVCTPQDIDTACTSGLKWPLGAARLADLVGLDTIYNALWDGYKRVGQEFYKPNPYLEKRIQSGDLGFKSKKGIYEY